MLDLHCLANACGNDKSTNRKTEREKNIAQRESVVFWYIEDKTIESILRLFVCFIKN